MEVEGAVRAALQAAQTLQNLLRAQFVSQGKFPALVRTLPATREEETMVTVSLPSPLANFVRLSTSHDADAFTQFVTGEFNSVLAKVKTHMPPQTAVEFTADVKDIIGWLVKAVMGGVVPGGNVCTRADSTELANVAVKADRCIRVGAKALQSYLACFKHEDVPVPETLVTPLMALVGLRNDWDRNVRVAVVDGLYKAVDVSIAHFFPLGRAAFTPLAALLSHPRFFCGVFADATARVLASERYVVELFKQEVIPLASVPLTRAVLALMNKHDLSVETELLQVGNHDARPTLEAAWWWGRSAWARAVYRACVTLSAASGPVSAFRFTAPYQHHADCSAWSVHVWSYDFCLARWWARKEWAWAVYRALLVMQRTERFVCDGVI